MTRPTPELKAAIVADRAAGMTFKALAEKHHVAENSAKRWFYAELEAQGVPYSKKPRITYTAEQKRQILDEHYASGRAVSASAEHHGIDDKTLAKWIKRDTAWIDDEPEVDIENGEWVLCPRRRIQVWRAA